MSTTTAYWLGVLTGVVGPLALLVVGYVGGRVAIRVTDWLERKWLARQLAWVYAQPLRSKEGAK